MTDDPTTGDDFARIERFAPHADEPDGELRAAFRTALLLLRDRLNALERQVAQGNEHTAKGFGVVADIGERLGDLAHVVRGDDAILHHQEGVDIDLTERIARLEKALSDRYDALEQMVELRTDLPGRDVHLHLPAHDAGAVLLTLEALGYPTPEPESERQTDDPRPTPSVEVEQREKDRAVIRIWRRGLEAIANGQADPQAVARAVLGGEEWDSVPTTNIRDITETHATRRLREARALIGEAQSSARSENRSRVSLCLDNADRIIRQVRDEMLRTRPAEPPAAPVAQDPGWHFPSGYGDDDVTVPTLTDDDVRTIRDAISGFSGGSGAKEWDSESMANARVVIEEVLTDAARDQATEDSAIFDPDLVTVLHEARNKAREAIHALDRNASGVAGAYVRGTRDLISRALAMAESGGATTPATDPQPADQQAINRARAYAPPADVKAVRETVDAITKAFDPERKNAQLTHTLHDIVKRWYEEQPAPDPRNPQITVPLGLAHAAAWMVEIPTNTNPDLQRRIEAFRDTVTQGLRDAFSHDANATFMHPLNTPWTPDREAPATPAAPSRAPEGSGNAPRESADGPQDAAEAPLTPLATFPGHPVALGDLVAQIVRTEPGDPTPEERADLQAGAKAIVDGDAPSEDDITPADDSTDDVVRDGPSGILSERAARVIESGSALELADLLAAALRYTADYVGRDLLPAVVGWSWYDALNAHVEWQRERARRSGGDVKALAALLDDSKTEAETFVPLSVRQARRVLERWVAQHGAVPVPPKHFDCPPQVTHFVPVERPDEVVRSRFQIAVDALDLIRRDTEGAESEALYAHEVATETLERLRPGSLPEDLPSSPPTGGPEGPGAPPEPSDPEWLPTPADRIPLRADFRMREHVAAALWRVAWGPDRGGMPFDDANDVEKAKWRSIAEEAERQLTSPDSGRAREALVILADAMRKIGGQDYRGNMPGDVRAAHAAIAEAQNAYNGVLPGNPTQWEAPF